MRPQDQTIRGARFFKECVLCLVGDYGVSAGAVASWRDLSRAANNATQSTSSKRPVCTAGGQAGRSFVRFDGVDDVLTLTNITAQASTIFVVAAHVTNTASFQDVYVTDAHKIRARQSAVDQWGTFMGVEQTSGHQLTSTPRILEYCCRAANDLDLVDNGSSVTLATGTAFPSRGASTIGADPTGVEFANIDVYALLHFNTAFSAQRRIQIRRWLGSYYQIATV